MELGQGGLRCISGTSFFYKGWLNSVTGSPGNGHGPVSLRELRHMVGLLGLGCAGPGAGLDLCGSLPTQDILWFYDFLKACYCKELRGSKKGSTLAFKPPSGTNVE